MKYFSTIIILTMTFLAAGWVFRIYDKGWVANGRDLATMSIYLWLWFSSVFYLVWTKSRK